jgi:DNA-directed RNA polymerase II subunit RPB1
MFQRDRVEKSRAERRKVRNVQFGVLSPDEIRTMSVVEVEKPDSHDERGRPVKDGIDDPRMGTNDRLLHCQSCSGSIHDCPGHFGHINLAMPVFNVGYLNMVQKVLRCVCFSCSKLLADSSDPRFKAACKQKRPTERFKMMAEACKGRSICKGGDEIENGELDAETGDLKGHGGCGALQPNYRKEGMKITVSWKNAEKHNWAQEWNNKPLTAEKAHHILAISAKRIAS